MRGPFKLYLVVGPLVLFAYFITSVRGVVFAGTDSRPGAYGGGGGGGGTFFWGSGYRGGK